MNSISISQTFVTKHPGLFHSHSTISIPNKLTENAKSLLHGVSVKNSNIKYKNEILK